MELTLIDVHNFQCRHSVYGNVCQSFRAFSSLKLCVAFKVIILRSWAKGIILLFWWLNGMEAVQDIYPSTVIIITLLTTSSSSCTMYRVSKMFITILKDQPARPRNRPNHLVHSPQRKKFQNNYSARHE